jgi:hypothetical protein
LRGLMVLVAVSLVFFSLFVHLLMGGIVIQPGRVAGAAVLWWGAVRQMSREMSDGATLGFILGGGGGGGSGQLGCVVTWSSSWSMWSEIRVRRVMRSADGTELLSGEWGEVGGSSEGSPLVSVGVSVGLGRPDTVLEGVLVAGGPSIVSAACDGRVACISVW